MKKLDAMYIVGFTDADGSICIVKTRYSYALSVSIVNTDLGVLKEIQKVMGEGNFKHRRRIGNHVQAFSLEFSHNQAKRFLERVGPYFIIKKRQALLALEFQSSKSAGRSNISKTTQEDYRNRINSFNHKGKHEYSNKFDTYFENVSQPSLAYVAGFTDGEGCVCIEHYKNYYKLVANITNSDFGVLKSIQSIVGGCLYEMASACSRYLPIFVLAFSPNKAKEFLVQVLPFLVVKRKQALLAVEFQSKRQKGRSALSRDESESYKSRISSLNKWRVANDTL